MLNGIKDRTNSITVPLVSNSSQAASTDPNMIMCSFMTVMPTIFPTRTNETIVSFVNASSAPGTEQVFAFADFLSSSVVLNFAVIS